jgi:hypothetical protein
MPRWLKVVLVVLALGLGSCVGCMTLGFASARYGATDVRALCAFAEPGRPVNEIERYADERSVSGVDRPGRGGTPARLVCRKGRTARVVEHASGTQWPRTADGAAHEQLARSNIILASYGQPASDGARQNRLQEALSHARSATTLAPEGLGLYWQGRAHELLGVPTKGLECFDALLARDDTDACWEVRDAKARAAALPYVVLPDVAQTLAGGE